MLDSLKMQLCDNIENTNKYLLLIVDKNDRDDEDSFRSGQEGLIIRQLTNVTTWKFWK